MTASSTVPIDEPPAPVPAPLRIRMAQPGRNRLDGAWWPHSRDLAVELADLVDHFPDARCHIVRALVSPPDWSGSLRRVPIGRGYLKVGSFPDDDTHLLLLTTGDRTVLRLLVVPPDFTQAQGEEALLAAATSGNDHSAADLLREVVEYPDVDPGDLWSAHGAH